MSDPAPLAQRVGLVTGGAHGIGFAIARRLAEDGAEVVISDLDAEGLHLAVERLCLGGCTVTGSVGDVRLPADTDAMVETARRMFGGLDIVVNNAGVFVGGAVQTTTDEEWNQVLDVTLRGTFNVVRSAATLLIGHLEDPPHHHRKVISISSIAGVHGGPAVGYSAAKGGQIAFSKSLAREWAPHRINVNVVAPGRVGGTRMSQSQPQPSRDSARGAIPETDIPLGRMGRPSDVADAVAYLAAPGSDYVTGQVLELHGGLEVVPRPQ
jgi:3-oxoacyl-[acyl-carrier protein] reductase